MVAQPKLIHLTRADRRPGGTSSPAMLRAGSGTITDDLRPLAPDHGGVARFLLHHWHQPHECASAFAAWSGFDSPLRRGRALSTCLTGGHRLWWQVEAEGEREALGLLPSFVARRASATQVREIEIP